MPLSRSLKILALLAVVGGLALAGRQGHRYYKKNLAAPRAGEVVYREDCMRCHGPVGQGVAGKADEPLVGEKSIAALAQYIAREMPESDPGSLSLADATASAEFIHHAFYSAEARARNHPPRIELAHLTVRQYRESIADLLGSLRGGATTTESGGLAGSYRGLPDGDTTNVTAKNEVKLVDRVDPALDFDFGNKAPAPGGKPEQFKINWTGSLLPPDTGEYEFRLTTPNGARLYVNVPENGTQKAPGGVWTVIPPANLSPKYSSYVHVVSVPLPPDDGSVGYERGASVSREWTEAVAKGALQVSAMVGPNLFALAGTKADAPDRAAKLKAFSLRFAQLAYRRPLTTEQQADLAALYAADVAPEVAAKRAFIFTLSNPAFLYPGIGPQDDHAVASRLALALWDSVPDAALLQAAAAGQLKTEAQVRAQARRLMKDPRAKAKLRDFLHHWLHVEEGAEIAKDQQEYPGFDQAVVMDLRTSLDLFTEGVVWSEASDYRQLLLGDTILMNERLAKFYGQQVPAGAGFQPVKMDADQRGGVGLAQRDAGLGQHVHRRFPRLVDPLGGQFGELGHPAADISALGVELLALQHGIEHAEVRGGVGAAPPGPLPTHGVRAEVGVDERVPVPLSAFVPRLEQVLHEHGGGDHAHAVVLPAGPPELAHTRVDDRVARATDLPGAQELLVRLPRELLELLAQRSVGRLGEMVDQVLRKLPPADLGHVLVAAVRAEFPRGAHGIDDLQRGDLAEVQVRR
ncbi:DUF1592 domain-containing protein [bacterium]|nr:DUF1592 domain-containing protein [bacterium]